MPKYFVTFSSGAYSIGQDGDDEVTDLDISGYVEAKSSADAEEIFAKALQAASTDGSMIDVDEYTEEDDED